MSVLAVGIVDAMTATTPHAWHFSSHPNALVLVPVLVAACGGWWCSPGMLEPSNDDDARQAESGWRGLTEREGKYWDTTAGSFSFCVRRCFCVCV